ncbi:MAG: hypothetical protein RIM84_25865 [Alphaproteobacteria bacterium]
MRIATTALCLTLLAMPAAAGTLENLERERAMLVETMLAPALSVVERQIKVEEAKRRLLDLERQVLRDDSLTGRATPTVRRAFASYDLTFLAHASAEADRAPVDLWLEQIGVSTESLMSARRGRR